MTFSNLRLKSHQNCNKNKYNHFIGFKRSVYKHGELTEILENEFTELIQFYAIFFLSILRCRRRIKTVANENKANRKMTKYRCSRYTRLDKLFCNKDKIYPNTLCRYYLANVLCGYRLSATNNFVNVNCKIRAWQVNSYGEICKKKKKMHSPTHTRVTKLRHLISKASFLYFAISPPD